MPASGHRLRLLCSSTSTQMQSCIVHATNAPRGCGRGVSGRQTCSRRTAAPWKQEAVEQAHLVTDCSAGRQSARRHASMVRATSAPNSTSTCEHRSRSRSHGFIKYRCWLCAGVPRCSRQDSRVPTASDPQAHLSAGRWHRQDAAIRPLAQAAWDEP